MSDQLVQAKILSHEWISLTDANAAWWASEILGKPVLLGTGGKECGIVNDAWIDEGGNVVAEVKLDPSVYDAAWNDYSGRAIA